MKYISKANHYQRIKKDISWITYDIKKNRIKLISCYVNRKRIIFVIITGLICITQTKHTHTHTYLARTLNKQKLLYLLEKVTDDCY